MDYEANEAGPPQEDAAAQSGEGKSAEPPGHSGNPAARPGTIQVDTGNPCVSPVNSGATRVVVGVGEEISSPQEAAEPSSLERFKTLLVGRPRDLADQSVFKHVSLIAFLAWVGLGADGLSSSCYGPADAFHNLADHRYLAVFLAGAIVATVFIISACYSHITFLLSMTGMCRHWWSLRGRNGVWRRRLALFVVGAVLCISILGVTVYQEFPEGGWITLAVTGACIATAFSIHRYYHRVGEKLKVLDQTLGQLSPTGEPNMAEVDPGQPAAVIRVGGYSGLGIHTLLNVVRFVPGHFRSRFLHNRTAYALQRRLQWTGLPMVILPTRVREPQTVCS